MADYLFISVFILFQLAFLIQLYFILMVHRLLAQYKHEPLSETSHPVSVIVCARNEEKNLKENLPAILEQQYPDFEVVVVNDCSVDESDVVLRELSERYKNLKIVTLSEHSRFKHGKKFAVTMGIKAAKNEYLLFTDADCGPDSPHWLHLMQQHFAGETEIVLGYSPYKKDSGPLNALIRFETFVTALNYFSFALWGRPYMGVGRNLAYKKRLFFRGKGFASHMHIPSGDDDLFVNQNATPYNTVIEIHPDTQVWTEPKRSFVSYFRQKLRHMGAGHAYKKRDKFILSLLSGSAVAFYVLLAALIALKAQWWILLSIYLIRLISQIIIYFPVLKKLRYRDLIWWLAALDLIYNFYIIVLSIIASFKKKVQWK